MAVFLILAFLGLGFFVIDHDPAATRLCTLASALESVGISRDGHVARGRMVMIMARPVVLVMIVSVAVISLLVRRFILGMNALCEENKSVLTLFLQEEVIAGKLLLLIHL